MKWLNLQHLILSSAMLIALMQVEAMIDLNRPLQAHEFKPQVHEIHPEIEEDEEPFLSNPHQRQPDYNSQHSKSVYGERNQDLPITDGPKKAKKSFSTKKFFEGVVEYLKKILKLIVTGKVMIYRTGKGYYKVPFRAAFRIDREWPEMEKTDQMKAALEKFTMDDLSTQIANHQWLHGPLSNALRAPRKTMIPEKEALARNKALDEIVMQMREYLEKLPSRDTLLEDREKEKEILIVKTLYVLGQNQQYTGRCTRAMETALETLKFKYTDETKPKLMPYIEAAYNLMLEHTPKSSSLPEKENAFNSSPIIEELH